MTFGLSFADACSRLCQTVWRRHICAHTQIHTVDLTRSLLATPMFAPISTRSNGRSDCHNSPLVADLCLKLELIEQATLNGSLSLHPLEFEKRLYQVQGARPLGSAGDSRVCPLNGSIRRACRCSEQSPHTYISISNEPDPVDNIIVLIITTLYEGISASNLLCATLLRSTKIETRTIRS